MTVAIKDYPKELDNEDRMNSLYAPFRPRELNPIGYDSKMKFWKAFIESSLTECRRCSFAIEELEKAFVLNGKKPACMTEVVGNLTSEINCEEGFMKLVPSNDTWTSWAIESLVSGPFRWTLNKIKDSIISPLPASYCHKFVHLTVAKRLASDLLSAINDDLRGTVITIEEVRKLSNNAVSENDLDIVLHYLELEKLAVVAILENKKLVKFAQKGKKIEPITDVEKTMFSLKQNEQRLLTSIENLEVQKQKVVNEAKEYLTKGMRSMAKSCLRKKKELEKRVDKQVAALDNINVLLAGIHEAESNSNVLESYKISVATLKNQLKEAGLSENNVSDTMSQIQEVLDIHDDIQTMLGEPTLSSTTLDEEYETELEELLKSKPVEKEVDSKFSLDEFDLPEPPTNSPSPVKTQSKISPVTNQRQALC